MPIADRDGVIRAYLDNEYDQHTGRTLLSAEFGLVKGETQEYINQNEADAYNVGPLSLDLALEAEPDETDVTIELAADDADGTVASWVIVTAPGVSDGTVDVGGSALSDATAVTISDAANLVYNAPALEGEYAFTYAAVDNDGKQGNTATVTVTVAAP